jgi:hypothetical protein
LAPIRPAVPGVVVELALGLVVVELPVPVVLEDPMVEALGMVPAGAMVDELVLLALVPVVPDVVALPPMVAPPLAPAPAPPVPLPAAKTAALLPSRARVASTAMECLVLGIGILLLVLPTRFNARRAGGVPAFICCGGAPRNVALRTLSTCRSISISPNYSPPLKFSAPHLLTATLA